MGFLSMADWARVHQAARYLCPGFNVSSPVGTAVETGVPKELLGNTFVDGLQEIEGWLDLAQVAEDLDTLEQDVWSGGTLSTQAARLKVFSSLRWHLADFLEQAAGGAGNGVLGRCGLWGGCEGPGLRAESFGAELCPAASLRLEGL